MASAISSAGRPGASAGKTEKIQRLIVPVQAVGLSLRDADFRRKYGVQVIAIEQADGSIQCPPDVEGPLKTDQRLIGIRSPGPDPSAPGQP